MTSFLTAAIVVAVAYVGVATLAHGQLPDSVSSMVWLLQPVGKWAWSLWLMIVGLLTCIPLIDVLPNAARPLGFALLCSIGAVASMPLWMRESVTAHWAFGILSCLLSQMCVIVLRPWCLLVWPLCVAVTVVTSITLMPNISHAALLRHKWVMLVEVACTAAIWWAVASALKTLI